MCTNGTLHDGRIPFGDIGSRPIRFRDLIHSEYLRSLDWQRNAKAGGILDGMPHVSKASYLSGSQNVTICNSNSFLRVFWGDFVVNDGEFWGIVQEVRKGDFADGILCFVMRFDRMAMG